MSSPDYLGGIFAVYIGLSLSLLSHEMGTELIPISRGMMNIQLNNSRRVLSVQIIH